MTSLNDAAQRIADQALGAMTERGFVRLFPALLQDADLILEWVGEDVRRRAYFLADMDGDEHWCLRIDHTIPAVTAYLEAGRRDEARYAYSGESFRRPAQGGDPRAGAFLETGVEIIAPQDPADAERQAVQVALNAIDGAEIDGSQLVAGDRTLFDALVERCEFTAEQAAAVRRRFAQGAALDDVSTFHSGPTRGDGLLGASCDDPTARRAVSDVFQLAGLREAGGRTIDDIAERLAAKARARIAPPSEALRAAVTRFLAVSGPPASALERCAAAARAAGADIDAEIERCAKRFDALTDDDPRWREADFSPAFGRKLHYYSGFVFEARHAVLGPDNPLAAGGRYDALFAHLGGAAGAAAMGAMVRPMRLARARAAEVTA